MVISIPPNLIAIDHDVTPTPRERSKMGNNANKVVAVVIKQGRIRLLPASTTEALTSSLVSGVFLVKCLSQIGSHNNSVISSYSKQSDKTNPNGYAQIYWLHLEYPQILT